ncbi:hypothetical protein PI124_g7390 [Phytophthora idaei]|nr:hypothetical protein PI126_g7170 [Phytophthora idaei]KAG3247932.1 hypothetical protein PI124_g7390 [Phytophthora idaei]
MVLYQICWTDLLDPPTCPPAVIEVDVTLGLNLLTLRLNGTFDMLGYAAGVLHERHDLAVGFDSSTALDFAYKGQSVLITQLTSALLDFTANERKERPTRS